MTLKRFAIGLTSAAILAAGAFSTPVVAQDIPNVLIFLEDSDKDTVPRNSRVQRNILSGMNDAMNREGYRVYDEQALGIDVYEETNVSDRVRRTDQELIVIANTVDKVTIDVAVMYEVFASVNKLKFASFARLRIAGRALDPRSGRFIGSFEVVSPKNFKLPVNCTKDCLLEALSEEGRDLGVELATVLAKKLNFFFKRPANYGAAPAPAPTPYTGGGGAVVQPGPAPATGAPGFLRTHNIEFNECSQYAISKFQPYLTVFEGYENHRPVGGNNTSVKYEYVSAINPGKLHRNLVKMLQHSGIPGQVNVLGNDYKIVCYPVRKEHPLQLNPAEW